MVEFIFTKHPDKFSFQNATESLSDFYILNNNQIRYVDRFNNEEIITFSKNYFPFFKIKIERENESDYAAFIKKKSFLIRNIYSIEQGDSLVKYIVDILKRELFFKGLKVGKVYYGENRSILKIVLFENVSKEVEVAISKIVFTSYFEDYLQDRPLVY